MYADPGKNGFDRRISSVSGLLRLLDAMPATEPPADLMIRTLQRIEQRTRSEVQTGMTPDQAAHPGANLRHPL